MPSLSTPPPPAPIYPLFGSLRRALGALGASLAGALAAGAVSGALRAPSDRLGGAAREAALFAPLAVAVAAVLVPLAVLASRRRLARVAGRMTETAARTRALAATLLVAPAAVVLWVALAARAGRFFMTAFHHVGLAALAQAAALALLAGVVGAAAALLRAAIALVLPAPARAGRVVVPALVLGLLLGVALLIIGVKTGDTDGRGLWLGTYGVLRKPELDLAPAWGVLGTAGAAALLALLACRSWLLALPVLSVSVAAAVGLMHHAAVHFAEAPSAAVIEARPGVARAVLRALRRRADYDGDGAAALYGGGDCDDSDPARHPEARDVPGNGVDEDCSGRDAPAAPPPPPPPPATVAQRAAQSTPADMNLVLITVDTLRWDLHYAGNPREISPNLDRLAAESVVFDRAYALSSYTGRAIGPMMTGRYPTECPRDNAHFTAYPEANVFLAERLRDAGFRTQGVASHFYFERRFGLAQGMETWDTSARPGGSDQETTSTDARVADRAIALLREPANATGRFFLWTHFFDPHKQYLPHREVPSFGSSERARYEGEVAFTDLQIGRILEALAALPFAARTMVVVTSDHGEAFNEHGMSWHGVELWEELVRVPWLMRVPGVTPRRVATPRSQIDLVPTLLELLRVPAPPAGAPDALSGTSLVGDLLGEAAPPRPIYLELPEGPFNSMRRSVVFDGWKLIERGAGRFELYNLAQDPGERTNLAATARDDLARMRAVLEQVRSRLAVVPPAR